MALRASAISDHCFSCVQIQGVAIIMRYGWQAEELISCVADDEMGYDDHGGNDYNNDYNDDYNNDYGGDEGMPDDPPLDEPQGTSPSRAPHPVEAVSASKAEEESAAAARSSANDSAEAPTPTPNRTVQQLVRCCFASRLYNVHVVVAMQEKAETLTGN